MQLTRHTDYALRILMYLEAQNEQLANVAEISKYYSISRNHLVKVVQGLTEHGYVTTTRGKNGGMKLARHATNISVGEVIRNMENHFDIVECFDHTNESCTINSACKLKGILHQAVNNFLKELDAVSLADVIKPELRSKLVNISVSL